MSKERFMTSNLLTISFLVMGIAFISIGILRQEFSVVLQKAINICLECVGIG